MLYSEIIAVCSQIHTKHISTLCGQNMELLNVKLMVHWTLKGCRICVILLPIDTAKSLGSVNQEGVG